MAPEKTEDEIAAEKAAADKAAAEKEAEEKAAPAGSKTEVSVYSKNGGYIRTYSLEVHGEKFAELAQEFADHTAGAVLK